MVTTRAAVRAYVRLPVSLTAPTGEAWHGRTRDLSKGGTLVFVEPPYPQGSVTVRLDLPGGALDVVAEVRFTIPGVGVGLQFTDLTPPQRDRIHGVVDAASTTFGLWGMVGKYLTEFDGRMPLKLPASNNESVFAELRASLGRAASLPGPSAELSHHVLHPVGENGVAYRILFTRPGCVSPSESDLAGRLSGFDRATQGKVRRVAPQDVFLKLHAGSQPKPHRVAELVTGAFAAIVVSEVAGSPPRISLLTLGLGEQIAIRLRETVLYPSFTDEELEVIKLDSVRRVQEGLVSASPVDLGTQRARFSDYAVFDEKNRGSLDALMKQDLQAEVRKYGARTVTLHPHILLRAKGPDGAEHVGVPMYDGRRYCLLQLTHDGFGRVVPLTREHVFSVLVR